MLTAAMPIFSLPSTRRPGTILAAFADLKEALEELLKRPVDLVEREAIETSRNFIRRGAILKEAEAIYG